MPPRFTSSSMMFLLFVRLRGVCFVGVDIGHTYIKIAKSVRLTDKNYELLDYLDIPFNAQISFRDPLFVDRLKEGVSRICDDRANCDIWGTIPSAKVETRRLRIPKLPRKQIPNADFWTFTNKVEFNESEEILDFEVLEEVNEGGVKKTDIMVFKTPKAEIMALKNVFDQIGYPLKGISIVPFAIQNLFRTKIITQPEQDVCCLFVGRDWSRIAIYSKSNLVLSRGIKAGMRSMAEAINIAMRQQDDWSPGKDRSTGAENDGAEPLELIQPAAQQLFFDFLHNRPVKPRSSVGKPAPDAGRVFQMILPAMERLIRQVERTFEHYMLNFEGQGVKRIYLSGQITSNAMLVNHIGQQLDLPVEVMNPFSPESSFARQVNIPQTQSERESYLPAIGLALSDNTKTPNVLFTHEDRDKIERVRLFNQRILMGCMVCLIALIALFSWQERQLDAQKAQIHKMNQKLLMFNPPAEKETLLALFAKTKQKRQTFEMIVRRYAPLAVIDELSQITPANIRLIDIDAVFATGGKAPSRDKNTIVISGVIFAESSAFEAALTGYLLNLKNSPIFSKPAIQSKHKAYYNNREVLRFSAKLEVL